MIVILVVILILIIVNAFFAASEMALVSLSSSDLYIIASEKHKNSNILLKVTKDSTKYLSTIQVTITFSGFLSSAFAGSKISGPLYTSLVDIGISIPQNILVIIITVLLSFITLVFGELVPKRIAMSNPKKLALFSAPIIAIVMSIFRPFVWLLTKSTNGIVNLLGFKTSNENGLITEQKIRELIVYGHIRGLYQLEERNMLERIFSLDDITASMIMTLRKDVVGLDISNVTESSYHQVIHSRYSRIPIFENNRDIIIGIIYIKDILLQLDTKMLYDVDLRSITREPLFVKGSENLNTLLKTMKKANNHIAIVLNQNNQYEGIVTLEDIVEEITGSIYDEHDIIDGNSESEFTYIVNGDMTTKEFNKRIGRMTFNTNDNTTISTFIISSFNGIPELKKSHIILQSNLTVEILSLENNEIRRIKIVLHSRN